MEFEKINLPFKVKRPILAVGSQTKNTVCLARADTALISPVNPDLSNLRDFLGFEKTVKYFLKQKPRLVAYDLHPEYLSSKYAFNLATAVKNLIPIQHHHAHIASCMVENGLDKQKVIGVAWDGTGLGADSTLWGAEFLVCDYKDFIRRARVKEIPLLGGERAISEPWRLAAIWLFQIYKDKFLNLGIDFVRGLDKKKWAIVKNMHQKHINSPLASSMGRLFDAVASILLVKYKSGFEADLAIALEKMAAGYKLKVRGYRFGISQKKNLYILDPAPMFKEIIADIRAKEAKEKIAYRFHLTLAEMISKVCLALREETGINQVVLSGGVFQNRLLLGLSLDLLPQEGFEVFVHKKLACHDANISLGQAAIANFRS